MPEAQYKPHKTLRTATKTAGKKTAGLGCMRKCKTAYAMGDIDEAGLETCLRNCQQVKG